MASRKVNDNKSKGKFSIIVIRKVVAMLRALIKHYMKFNPEDLKLCVSKGNKKIGHVLNVSLAPIVTCGNCGLCKFWCYDLKACLAYPSVLRARARNTALFYMSRDLYFAKLYEVMAKRKNNKYLRFHVSGEIVDIDHFERMVKTAIDHPDWTIWTYTKMYHVVNAWIDNNGSLPENFHVMFSGWDGVKMDNKHGLPVFCCAFRDEQKIGFECPGSCAVCIANNVGCVAGMSSYVLPH